MLWTAKDDETIRQCRRCLENCRHYNTPPAAWFTLCIKMYEELKDAGLLEKQELEESYCDGCVYAVCGCWKAYAGAVLDEERKKVVSCTQKISASSRRKKSINPLPTQARSPFTFHEISFISHLN